MRVFVLAAMLLASSSLCSFAQEQGNAPAAAPQAGPPAQADQNSQPQRDQKADRSRRPTTARWVRTGECAAATATACTGKTGRRSRRDDAAR